MKTPLQICYTQKLKTTSYDKNEWQRKHGLYDSSFNECIFTLLMRYSSWQCSIYCDNVQMNCLFFPIFCFLFFSQIKQLFKIIGKKQKSSQSSSLIKPLSYFYSLFFLQMKISSIALRFSCGSFNTKEVCTYIRISMIYFPIKAP